MSRTDLFFIALLSSALLLLSACTPVEETPAETQPSDNPFTDTQPIGIPVDQIIETHGLISSKQLLDFEVTPACDKGEIAVSMHYETLQIHPDVTLQVSTNKLSYTDFDSWDGIKDTYELYSICDECPEGTELAFSPGKRYYLRLFFLYPDNTTSVSNNIELDLTQGSPYLTKDCNQAPDDVICFDSDDNNPDEAGYLFSQGKKFEDYCDPEDPNYVIEFTCNREERVKEKIFCENGCQEAACIG